MSDFKIEIDLNVLNHLGMSLYSNTPAVLTEIISNAWDADAKKVDISLVTGDEPHVVIEDNGHGMSESDIIGKFLKVGYARRDDKRGKSDGLSRQVMGRKGIGKLAMFSLANKIQVFSRKKGHEPRAFEIDVSALQDSIKKNQTYTATPIEFNSDITEGTTIKLYELKKSIDRTQTYLRKRIARRFSVIGEANEFEVVINGHPITTDDRDFLSDLEFIWEFGCTDKNRISACKNLLKKEILDNVIHYNGKDYNVSGYIGSVEKPSHLTKDPEISNNTITIISNGRVFEEDILLEFGSAKVFTNYLVGEIVADFLDDNELPDMATSSRQKLQQNDPRYPVLKAFFDNCLGKIDKDWDEWRRAKGIEDAKEESSALKGWLMKLKSSERKAAEKLIGKVNTFRFSGDDVQQSESKKIVLKNTVLAFEKLRIQDNLDSLDKISSLSSEAFKEVFSSVDDIEASLFYEITSQRLKVIEKFNKITEDNELEKTVQEYLYKHLWLLDPSWERVTGETYIEQTLSKELKAINPDATSGARIDIAYKTISGKHVIIEMKRPKVQPDIMTLVAQGNKYRQATNQWYMDNPKSCPNGKVPVVDVIFLLGKNYDMTGMDSEFVRNQLLSINGKVLTYKDLITQSYQSYQEYLERKKEAAELSKLINSI
ncbi:BbrUII/HgiDII family restriction enzyme [Vibrio harveyi]|uniref:BbrUII/HgiDII family restriction enzyme n=1 Tax=Vibrio harveyi TaxID=669 RepID=UPI004068CF99